MQPRTPIDLLLDQVAWQATPPPTDQESTLPYATHEGMLTIPGFGALRVYQLSTGERIINADDFEKALGMSEEDDHAQHP